MVTGLASVIPNGILRERVRSVAELYHALEDREGDVDFKPDNPDLLAIQEAARRPTPILPGLDLNGNGIVEPLNPTK
jgi:hypothetical protein